MQRRLSLTAFLRLYFDGGTAGHVPCAGGLVWTSLVKASKVRVSHSLKCAVLAWRRALFSEWELLRSSGKVQTNVYGNLEPIKLLLGGPNLGHRRIVCGLA